MDIPGWVLSNEEDQQHLFVEYDFAKQIWLATQNLRPYNNAQAIKLITLLQSLHANDSVELSQLSRALLLCWQLWNKRNNTIFRNTKQHPTRVLLVASSLGQDYLKANMKVQMKENKNHTGLIKWTAPSNHALHINFEGYVIGDNAAAGFVIRDSNGCPIVVGTWGIGHNTIYVAESLALRDALKFAHSRGFSNVVVEGVKPREFWIFGLSLSLIFKLRRAK